MADVCVLSAHTVQTFQVTFSIPWCLSTSNETVLTWLETAAYPQRSLNGMREVWLSKQHKQGHVWWFPHSVYKGSDGLFCIWKFCLKWHPPENQNKQTNKLDHISKSGEAETDSYSMDASDGNADKGYSFWTMTLAKILPALKLRPVGIYKRNGRNPFMFFQKNKPKRILPRCYKRQRWRQRHLLRRLCSGCCPPHSCLRYSARLSARLVWTKCSLHHKAYNPCMFLKWDLLFNWILVRVFNRYLT